MPSGNISLVVNFRHFCSLHRQREEVHDYVSLENHVTERLLPPTDFKYIVNRFFFFAL